MTDKISPLVSISSMSKNLEAIISDGVESWLAQQTTFEFDIIISDDYSTDNTVAILKKYELAHPEKIKVLTTDRPLGLGKNWIKSMQACTGKYIAFCDGDDLWTDKQKLQKQIEYMEDNPDCNLVCADYDRLNEKGELIVSEWKKEWYGKKFDVVDNLIDSIATTLTVVIRKSALDPLLNKITLFNHPFIWDSFLWAFALQKGHGYFYPEKLALRRVQSTGIYTTKSELDRSPYDFGAIQSIKTWISDKRVQAQADESLYILNITVAGEYFRLGNRGKGRRHLLKSVFQKNGTRSLKKKAKYIYWFIRSFTGKMPEHKSMWSETLN